MLSNPLNILNTSVRPLRILRFESLNRFISFSLSSQGTYFSLGIVEIEKRELWETEKRGWGRNGKNSRWNDWMKRKRAEKKKVGQGMEVCKRG